MKSLSLTAGRVNDKLYLYVPSMGLGIPVLQDEGGVGELDNIMTITMGPDVDLRYSSDPGWSKEEKVALMRILYRLLDQGIKPTGPRRFTSPCLYCGRLAPNVLPPICKLCV